MKWEEELNDKVDDLHKAEDWKSDEKSHGATYQPQLGLCSHLQSLCYKAANQHINMATTSINITFTSLSISSYVAVSKKISTSWRGASSITLPLKPL